MTGTSANVTGQSLAVPAPAPVRLPHRRHPVLDRWRYLLVETAGGGEAGDCGLVCGGVKAEEALEHRGVVPVEQLGVERLQRAVYLAWQRSEPVGHKA